jgi:tetratricopeptide (TPR) repeat protein
VRVAGRLALETAWLAALACCAGREERAPAAPPDPPAVEVAFAGCTLTRPGWICEIEPGAVITVWARAQDRDGDGNADGEVTLAAPAATPAVAVAGGSRWAIPGRPGDDIEIHARWPGQATPVRRVRIQVRAAPIDPVLARAGALRKQGQLVEAAAVLAEAGAAVPDTADAASAVAAVPAADAGAAPGAAPGATSDAEIDPVIRARRESLAARIALAAGDREAAEHGLVRSLEAAEGLGLGSQAALDAMALAWLRTDQWARYQDARAAIERAERQQGDYPEARAQVPYYRALVALETGDLRSALDDLEQAETWSQRLDRSDMAIAARQMRARALQAAGHHDEAAQEIARLRDNAAEVDACSRAYLALNAGWIALLQREAEPAQRPGQDPIPPLEEALALFSGACESPAERANVRVNLALAEIQSGRPARAAAHLSEARAEPVVPSVRLRLWILDIEARAALAAGRAAEALAQARRLEALAEAVSSPEARWRALLRQADALEAQGRLEDAIAADARAEAGLSAEALRVPIDTGRERFLAQREQGAATQIRRLPALGRTGAALAAARRARRRAIEALHTARRLAALEPSARQRWEAAVVTYRREREALDAEAADDWRLATERLAEVQAARQARRHRIDRAVDEAVAALALGAHGDAAALRAPAPGELLVVMHPAFRGWYVFAAAAESVAVHRVDDPARALAGVDAAIARTARVTILPYGPSWNLDLHAQPWRGQPLVLSRPVAYGLDLPPLAASTAPLAPRILLVDDPAGDLPAARAEAGALAASLGSRGTLDRLSGDQATGAAVRAALPRASLFHYAGHGRFAGWESHLPLAGDSRLRIGDILTLARVPEHVILSGCETARTSAHAAPESLGIAQAFLAAGASQVVAAVRPVDDALAAALGPLLHAGAAGPDLVLALQRAQIDLARTRAAADWPAFRVLVR